LKKLNYIIAAIFQGINRKVKNDTPYFNTLMLITFAIIIHITQLIIILKIKGLDIIQLINRSVFIISFIVLIFLILFFLKKIFPFKEVSIIEVQERDKRIFYNGMIIYFLISVSLLVILFLKLKQHLGL
jgi:hypothetical protein